MAESQFDLKVFSVRIVSIDYYMAPPIPGFDISYSSFQGGKVNEVPVIRIYGSTPAGQKTCLHVHRALPYLYVQFSDLLLQPDEEGDACTHAISLAIEKALKLKGNAGSKRQHVHSCSLVRAKKFYGYHSSEELFAKIYLYYPQDVSQAATLLLGGAVLDKILQPHESHIPFLLQFLVDYNLYGMGHLHVSKMKFRHPVPDVFAQRKFNYNRQHRQQTDNSTCMATDFQADSSGDSCSSSPIWLSSTIPDGWIWQFPSQFDPLTDQDINLVKRQSTCGLEGDAVVDDILNQQFISYSSLSQTHSDVKMVQSLIPIWEEEFERTGMHGAALPSNPAKPLPEDVLRTLSHGLEFENKLKEFCNDAESSSTCIPVENDAKFSQSIRSSTDQGNMDEFGHVNAENNRESSKFSEADDEIGLLKLQDSLRGDDDGAKHGEGRDEHPKQLSADELPISDTVEPLDAKVADQEALMLLKWLASSQAADDINSDDELVRETILSPLLPATTIDKVLEKANIDFESESQQECQDILDSVEDLIKFEDLKGTSQSTDHYHSCQMSSKKTIPLVDGSSDDQNSILSDGKSSKVEMNSESEKSLQDSVRHDISSCFTIKHKRERPPWSSLPFSLTHKVDDDVQPFCSNLTGRCNSDTKDGIGRCSWVGNEADKCSDVGMGDEDIDVCNSKEASTVVGCSVRDLMRKKRCHRVEPPERETPHVGKFLFEEEWKEDAFLCTKWRGDGQDVRPLSSAYSRSSLTDERTEFHERNLCAENCALEGGGNDCNIKIHNSICPVFGKLPLSSSSNDGCFRSSKGLDDVVVTGATSGSGNFRVTGPLSLHGVTKELTMFLNSENQNSTVNFGHCGNQTSSVNRIRPQNSDVDTCKFDPYGRMLKADGDDKHLETEKLLQTDATGSICLSSCPVESEFFVKDAYVFPSGYDSRISMQRGPAGGMEGTSGTTFLQSDNLVDGHHGRDTGISGPGSSESMVVNFEANPVEIIGMSFCKKPPVIQWTDETSGNALSTPAIPNCPCPADEENYEGTSVQDRVLDECLPFFVGDCLEGKEVQDIGCGTNFNYHKEGVMGVPTHYQNDGSYLYMLTPVFSPPSTDSVHRWLLLDGTDNLRENVYAAIVEPSSLNGSSGNMMDSQGSLADACNEPLLESASMSDAKPILDQVDQQTRGCYNAEVQPFHNVVPTVLQSEGDILKVKRGTGCSQDISQISGPDGKSKLTPLSQIGFRDPASVGGGQQLTLLSIEVQAESRGDLRPDPRFDAINLVVLVIQEDDDSILDAYVLLRSDTESVRRNLDGITGCKVLVSSEEKHLFNHFMKITWYLDPDILMGWDIQGGSLGFLAERAAHIGIGLLDSISRTPSQINVTARDLNVLEKGILNDVLPESLIADSIPLEDTVIEDEWGRTHASGVHVGGRVVLNVWRLIRSEVKLNVYTAEAVAEAVLRQKIPSIHCKVLTKWFSSGPGRARYRCVEYVLERTKLNLQIINQLDMINRTSELARVFGIDFFSVLSRGSQYRVESMFLRLAHTQNYLAISPGSQQVASQPAMECLPLVMEPESGFYGDPVVVLDFQSLYPSMIIAYNLCFCTCLGKVAPLKPNTLGVGAYLPDPNILRDFEHEILLTPNGVMYVPSKVRKGVLPRLLEEILSTRIMVKQAMKKLAPSQQVLNRIFNARQLALKLIANVTYGYTAAGFSGRMPCAELADSIVQCARRTLENAISFVNTHDKWKAKVIYGDTDSMFVLLRGHSVKESLQIGLEIASAVTAMNPSPVTLKMEKVYHPCFLLTKKRYVGYSYESPDQVKPVFNAKGIETVRRDTCEAVSKMMEQSLRLFFEHQDINKVKSYLLRQWTRILSGRVSLQDFVFSKEVRLGTYSTRASSLPPAAIVATKAMRADPRAEPRYAERIPYVVVHGEPGARLVDMVVDPLELLAIDSPFRLNDLYYINKQIIPALQRVFGLVGADLNQWFSDMPRPVREAVGKHHSYAPNPHRTRIDYYYLSKHCILCGELVQASDLLCAKCCKNEGTVATALTGRTVKLEREIQHLAAICRHCGGGDWLIESGVKCTSLACSVFYERRKIQKELQSLSAVATEAGFYPRCMIEWF